MSYLKSFWKIFKEFIYNKKNYKRNLSKVVSPREVLCRYLTYSKYFQSSKNRVTHEAFLPPKNLKLSVFRIDGLGEGNIWKIAEDSVINKMSPPRTLYGRANITVAQVHEVSSNQMVNLKIDPDNTPIRHANILGWPEEKSKRKLIALELAENAKLILR